MNGNIVTDSSGGGRETNWDAQTDSAGDVREVNGNAGTDLAGDGREMNGNQVTDFEVALMVPKKILRDNDSGLDCIDLLVSELQKAGLIVERVAGLSDEFLKLAAPLKVMGKAAAELQIKKLTYVGVDLQFDWDQIEAFVRQPDGSLFNWCERFRCFHHLIYGISNKQSAAVTLTFDRKEFMWEIGGSLLEKMELEGIVKQVFPVHDETKRKLLLRKWALNWLEFTWQPIDEIYAYFGTKIATYFAFLGMYTRWLFFPAIFALTLQLVDVGSWQLLMPPIFFIFTITWAVLFLQFWKRKNSALLSRWLINYPGVADDGVRNCVQSNVEKIENKPGTEKPRDEKYRREEWFERLLKFRNDAIVVLGIIVLQLPFELAYAHLYEIAESDIMRFGLTAVYLLVIQYYTKIGGKISVMLIKNEPNRNTESSADSLVYKVFGLYFMQSYIGLFYHAVVYRNVLSLRQVLIQRLIVSQVFENLLENSIPYLKYSYKKYRAVHSHALCVKRKRKGEKGSTGEKMVQLASRVEKEYLKPSYTASIGKELEDGLFDDFLELALQFGLIMMFACAFPLAFAFSLLNNITEIRTDALKLLVMMRRPIPRAAASIGAWLNIFQFLIVMAICTNCALLVCLYDEEGKWSMEPGLAAILIIEHVVLLIKFGFSHFVPEVGLNYTPRHLPPFSILEMSILVGLPMNVPWMGNKFGVVIMLEPAWVKANREKNVLQAQEMCSKQLKSIYSLEKKRD